jgi:hypothetical protein
MSHRTFQQFLPLDLFGFSRLGGFEVLALDLLIEAWVFVVSAVNSCLDTGSMRGVRYGGVATADHDTTTPSRFRQSEPGGRPLCLAHRAISESCTGGLVA